MRLAITGGTGLVGRFITEAALAAGHGVTLLTRNAPAPGSFSAPVAHLPYDLEREPPPLDGVDGLIHAAFDHMPGRYRGGEGSDPEGFRCRNVLGSRKMLDMARDAGCRVIFLSSRAVYGAYPPGSLLTESTPARPDTLYGQAKLEVEQTVAEAGGMSLRATGVYGPPGPGPGQRHKWAELFADFAAGREIAPRRGTEVHGADLAAACLIALETPAPPVLNVSDIMLDRRDLLELWSSISGVTGRLPEPAPQPGPAEMDCTALRGLGWVPGGRGRLCVALARIAQSGAASTP
ncbi:MAG: NAD(P)-dependent oxidoreductase [Rhodobacteraceae bacterium]|nr:NAD(P)-dependent oxidoreductase [Paracoccaceae bacterium]